MHKDSTIRLNIHSYTAISEFWNALGPFIHELQTQPHDLIVSREAEFVLAVRHSTDREVMLRATVPVVDDNWFRTKVAHLLERRDEFTRYGATLTVWTRELGSGEVWTEVTHTVTG